MRLIHTIWYIIKKHPFSIAFYLFYAFMWYRTSQVFKLHIIDSGLLGVAGVFTAIIFIVISLLNAYFTKSYKFYLCLIVLIIIPAVVVFLH